jgi:hypothetical protein
MKRRRPSAQRMKLLRVARKQRSDRRRYFIMGCGITAMVRAVAAALAARTVDPMLARSAIADAITSGAAITNAIPHPSSGHQRLIGTPKA